MSRLTHSRWLAAAAAVALILPASSASAQQDRQQSQKQDQQANQRQQRTQDQEGSSTLTLPASQDLVRLSVTGAQEVRVGESSHFDIDVTNVSDNIMLHDVKVSQQIPQGMEIESSQLLGEGEEPSQAQSGQGQQNREQSQSKQNQQGQQQKERDQQDRQRSQQSEQRESQGSQSQAQQRDDQAAAQQEVQQSAREAKQGQDEQDQDQASQQGQDRSAQKQQAQKQDGQQQGSSQQAQQQMQGGKATWTIDRLAPGETRTIRVTVISDQEGEARACLAVEYQPSLCLVTRFVKPDLQLTKQGPKESALCEPITWRYQLKNTGSGATEKVTIRDQLPSGLQTLEGKNEVTFEVEKLEPNQSRDFEAQLVATRSGSFGSRAVAVQKNGDRTQSQRVETQFNAARLAVNISGPGAESIGDPVTFTIEVKNQGDAPALQSELVLNYEDPLEVVGTSDVQRIDQEGRAEQRQQGKGQKNQGQQSQQGQSKQGGQQSQSQRGQQQPTPAGGQQDDDNQQTSDEQRAQRQNQQAQQQGQQDQQGQQQAQRSQEGQQNQQDQQKSDSLTRQVAWNLGTLKPGDTVRVKVTTVGHEGGTFNMKAVASHYCGVADRVEQLQMTSQTQAFTQLEVIALPALLLSVVDVDDPVEVDGEISYGILVKNQGTATANHVQLKGTMPEELEFISAKGQTDVTADGKTLNFQPIDQLEPNEQATYTVKARAKSAGNIRFQIDLTSKTFQRPTTAEEPTTVYQAAADQPSTTR